VFAWVEALVHIKTFALKRSHLLKMKRNIECKKKKIQKPQSNFRIVSDTFFFTPLVRISVLHCWRGLLAFLMYMAIIMIWWDNHLLLRNNMTMWQRIRLENAKIML